MDDQNEIRIIETPLFVENTLRRSWRERFFSWPWRPWVKSHTVQSPSMARLGYDIFCHPSLLSSAERMVEHCKEADVQCSECEWAWDSASSNGMCEFCDRRPWLDEVERVSELILTSRLKSIGV